MPTSAATAGLVMGATLDAGLLCLGAYVVHRYMDWRCREVVDLFQRTTVRVVKVEGLECNKKSRETRNDEEQGGHMLGTKPALGRSQGPPKAGTGQDIIWLRGGSGYGGLENDLSQGDVRQMQPYLQRPAQIHAQPTARRQELGWHQFGDTYDPLWQPSAISQQTGPQGGYYAYMTPHPKAAMAYGQQHLGHPTSYDRFADRPEQHRVHGGEAQIATEPISFEGDSIVVVGDHPFVIEGVMHVGGKKRRKTSNKRRKVESRQSSSTELGTCSSDRSSTSTEEMPQGRIPSGALRRAQPLLRDSTSFQESAQRIARDEGGEDSYAPQPHRRSERHGREAGGGVQSGLRRASRLDGRQQAGNAFPYPCFTSQGQNGPVGICLISTVRRSLNSEPGMRDWTNAVSKSGFKEEQHCNAFANPGSSNSKSGPVVKESASHAPCKKGKSAVQNGPPTSALHSTRLTMTKATNKGMQQDAVGQPASDTATVGRIEGTRPRPGP